MVTQCFTRVKFNSALTSKCILGIEKAAFCISHVQVKRTWYKGILDLDFDLKKCIIRDEENPILVKRNSHKHHVCHCDSVSCVNFLISRPIIHADSVLHRISEDREI
jgi:hypothetical protein